MNTNKTQQKPVQIPVRDILVSRLNVLEGRFAEYQRKFPTANFVETTKCFAEAERILCDFNPKGADTRLVDHQLVKGDRMMVAAILQVSIEANEKQQSKPEVKVTAPVTGQFVGEAKEVNVEAVLAGKNMLPMSTLRDLKAAASTPNRSKRQESKGKKKDGDEGKKKGSKRPGGVPKVGVTTKERTKK